MAIIEDAEKRGELKPGMTVVEATSGNTGIAVAMVCAQRGYDCVICMAEPFSVERRRLMRMLGAKVIVTPKAGKGTGIAPVWKSNLSRPTPSTRRHRGDAIDATLSP